MTMFLPKSISGPSGIDFFWLARPSRVLALAFLAVLLSPIVSHAQDNYEI